MLVTRSILEVLARCSIPFRSSRRAHWWCAISTSCRTLHATIWQVSRSASHHSIRKPSVPLEPRAASPQARLRTVKQLSQAGIPVGILVAPVIPALTDHEMERIMEAAVEMGARWAGYVMLRLSL